MDELLGYPFIDLDDIKENVFLDMDEGDWGVYDIDGRWVEGPLNFPHMSEFANAEMAIFRDVKE